MEKCFTCVKNVICLLTLMVLGIFLVSCGTGQGTATTTANWTEQTLAWAGTPEPVTSTSTIITPEGTYRQYFTGPGGIWTATSNDGISWAAPVTSLSTLGATNPAVIQLKDCLAC